MARLKSKLIATAITGIVMAASATAVQAGGIRSMESNGESRDWRPTGQGHGRPDINAPGRVNPETGEGLVGKPIGYARQSFRPPQTNAMSYHGGQLLGGTPSLYYIWYGNWTGNTATTILTDLVSNNMSNSPRYRINMGYSTANTPITGTIAYGGSTTNNYTLGKTLSDAGVQSVVSSAISSGQLPYDPSGVYFVLTSSDVKESSGFCSSYCGWHSYSAMNIPGISTPGTTIKYAFVGNPDQCPTSCEGQTGTSPNANPGADAMASIIVHELEETVTDPEMTGWYDSRGLENSDKCAWTFGTTYKAANGSKANVKLGARDFYIQQNWSYTLNTCVMQ